MNMQILIHTNKSVCVCVRAQLPSSPHPQQILENLEKGLAEDGSMITLTQENRQGKLTHTQADRHLATDLACSQTASHCGRRVRSWAPVGNTHHTTCTATEAEAT